MKCHNDRISSLRTDPGEGSDGPNVLLDPESGEERVDVGHQLTDQDLQLLYVGTHAQIYKHTLIIKIISVHVKVQNTVQAVTSAW
jgi:hypothetical protein